MENTIGQKGHQPERFKEYDEAKDGSGFFLPDGAFFQFDKLGGWFDEFGNYYNGDGQPSKPPKVEGGITRDDEDSSESDGGDDDVAEDIQPEDLDGFEDGLIQDYEEGANIDDNDDYEEIDPEEEARLARIAEQECRHAPDLDLTIKVNQMPKGGSVNCVVRARSKNHASGLETDLQALAIPFKQNKLSGRVLTISVERSQLPILLSKVFDRGFYDKYSFHLDNDEDDDYNEVAEDYQPEVAKVQKVKQLFGKETKLKRKPLQLSSSTYTPDAVDDRQPDQPISTPNQAPQNTPAPVQVAAPVTATRPADSSRGGKPAGGARKPLGSYN